MDPEQTQRVATDVYVLTSYTVLLGNCFFQAHSSDFCEFVMSTSCLRSKVVHLYPPSEAHISTLGTEDQLYQRTGGRRLIRSSSTFKHSHRLSLDSHCCDYRPQLYLLRNSVACIM